MCFASRLVENEDSEGPFGAKGIIINRDTSHLNTKYAQFYYLNRMCPLKIKNIFKKKGFYKPFIVLIISDRKNRED